jgi:hypothetical protein
MTIREANHLPHTRNHEFAAGLKALPCHRGRSARGNGGSAICRPVDETVGLPPKSLVIAQALSTYLFDLLSRSATGACFGSDCVEDEGASTMSRSSLTLIRRAGDDLDRGQVGEREQGGREQVRDRQVVGGLIRSPVPEQAIPGGSTVGETVSAGEPVCEGYTAARLEEPADISGILAGSRPTSPAAETEQLCQMAGWPGVHVALSAVVGGNRDCQQRQPPQEQAQGRLGLRRRLPARPLYGQADQRDRRAASCSATASGCGTGQIAVADSLGVRAAPLLTAPASAGTCAA